MWLQRYGIRGGAGVPLARLNAEGDKDLRRVTARRWPLARVTARSGRIKLPKLSRNIVRAGENCTCWMMFDVPRSLARCSQWLAQ